jgi:hypothetical protein
MKYYDMERALEIINKYIHYGLEEAYLGMKEDMYFTSELVWSREGWESDLSSSVIQGITHSQWATPILRLVFEDKNQRDILCYTEKDD